MSEFIGWLSFTRYKPDTGGMLVVPVRSDGIAWEEAFVSARYTHKFDTPRGTQIEEWRTKKDAKIAPSGTVADFGLRELLFIHGPCGCCEEPATALSPGRGIWVCAEHLLLGEEARG